AFGYSLLAYKSLLKGTSKLKVNRLVLKKDLEGHWEVLAEAIQTVMRKCGVKKPYEKLKKLTRGRKVNEEDIKVFVEELEIPQKEKEKLFKLKPANYIGLAEKLTK
ncbi:MAG TPA: adenylosuccinate lyase, partial [Candidatus Peregrinibacteria bacterium]|nr:adenylosuccinate lyase [Candidatus Peregrinibacteria bacterium]